MTWRISRSRAGSQFGEVQVDCADNEFPMFMGVEDPSTGETANLWWCCPKDPEHINNALKDFGTSYQPNDWGNSGLVAEAPATPGKSARSEAEKLSDRS